MMIFSSLYKQNREEYWNVLTHLIGGLLAVTFSIFLLRRCEEGASDFKFVSVVIFGLSSLLVYITSVLFHLNWNKSSKHIYRTVDHISIFYLIAGSYTPFLLTIFPPEVGWRMMTIVWSIAFIGTIYKFYYTGKHENFSLLGYVLMGWSGLIEYETFVTYIPSFTMSFIIAGGLLYLVGIIFFKVESIKYNHAIWHVFVLLANLAHFAAVFTIL